MRIFLIDSSRKWSKSSTFSKKWAKMIKTTKNDRFLIKNPHFLSFFYHFLSFFMKIEWFFHFFSLDFENIFGFKRHGFYKKPSLLRPKTVPGRGGPFCPPLRSNGQIWPNPPFRAKSWCRGPEWHFRKVKNWSHCSNRNANSFLFFFIFHTFLLKKYHFF